MNICVEENQKKKKHCSWQTNAAKMAKINRGKRGIEPRASSNFMFKFLNPNEESYH